jgi:hypothetical protein
MIRAVYASLIARNNNLLDVKATCVREPMPEKLNGRVMNASELQNRWDLCYIDLGGINFANKSVSK